MNSCFKYYSIFQYNFLILTKEKMYTGVPLMQLYNFNAFLFSWIYRYTYVMTQPFAVLIVYFRVEREMSNFSLIWHLLLSVPQQVTILSKSVEHSLITSLQILQLRRQLNNESGIDLRVFHSNVSHPS